jgi:hypothetical protein
MNTLVGRQCFTTEMPIEVPLGPCNISQRHLAAASMWLLVDRTREKLAPRAGCQMLWATGTPGLTIVNSIHSTRSTITMSNPPGSGNAAAGPSRGPPKFVPKKPVRLANPTANGGPPTQPAATVTGAPIPVRTASTSGGPATTTTSSSAMGIGAGMRPAASASGDVKPRMVFKPSMPTRKVKTE